MQIWATTGSTGTDTVSFTIYNYLSGSTLIISDHGVKIDLTKHTFHLGFLGTKTIYNFENIDGTQVSDKLYGTSGANSLNGVTGNDWLEGRQGADTLIGSDGKDTVFGGAGADVLVGMTLGSFSDDGDRDIFRYTKTSESGKTSLTWDTIWGTFDGAASDKIDLSAIDADGSSKDGNGKFKFIADAAFHAAAGGEVQVVSAGTNLYLVSIDTDKDTGAEMQILVHSLTLLTTGDFVL